MKVRDVMRSHARTCGVDDDLATVGRLMADVGCGVLPVVAGMKVLGMITDRDLCLALTAEDLKPSEMKVSAVTGGRIFACHPGDELGAALQKMGERRVRRLPVVDDEQQLVGLISLDDVVAQARSAEASSAEDRGSEGSIFEDVVRTLQAINRHEVPAVQ